MEARTTITHATEGDVSLRDNFKRTSINQRPLMIFEGQQPDYAFHKDHYMVIAVMKSNDQKL